MIPGLSADLALQRTAETAAGGAVDSMRRFAAGAGLFAAAAGVAVLFGGWAAGLDVLKRLLPGAATMKANTALGLAALGAALWLLARGRPPWPARGFAGLAAVLGGLTLLETLAGVDVGIDQLLFTDAGGGPHPGRMAPATALAMTAQAVALLLLAGGRAPAGQWVALAPFLLGATGVTAYAFEREMLPAVAAFASMSPPTAMLFALLGAAALCLRAQEGFMRRFASPGLGGSMARRMLAALLLIAPLGWWIHAGAHAGLYPEDFGLLLLMLAAMALLAGFVWFLAGSVDRGESRLRLSDAVLRQMNEGVTVTDAAGRIVTVNGGFTRITGYAADEVLGRNPRLLQSGVQGPEFYAAMWRSLLRDGHWQGEIINRRKSGELYPEILSISAVRDADGGIGHYVGVFADLSERLVQERRLRALADRLDLALTAGHVGTWHYEPLGGRFECDDNLLRLHGIADPSAPRRLPALLHLVQAEDRERVRAAFAACAAGAALEIEYRVALPDGRRRHLAARGHAQRREDGNFEAAGACWDVTERRAQEEQIRSLNESLEQRVAERTLQLEAMVKEMKAFSYTVAHDLRAPLRGLDGFSHVLMEDYGERLDGPAREHLQRIRAASQRMGSLIDHLLELARLARADMQRSPLDLGAVAREIVGELRREEPARRVEVRIADGLRAEADPTLARDLIENLLRNAWKYTAKTAAARIEFESQCAQDGGTEFCVRDNGAGFDMQYAGKLFQPFQRLHRDDDFQGTGIGLASAARIVARHGGRIRAEAAVGRGAAFHFTLAPGPGAAKAGSPHGQD